MRNIFKILAMTVGLLGVMHEASAAPVEPNIDRKGGDYTSVTLPSGASAGNCRALCAADGGKCKAWTYVKPGTGQGPNPRCWLKSVVPAALSSTCCTSGTMRAPRPQTGALEANTDRRGGDYTSVTLPAGTPPQHCRQLCTADGSACKAWTYVKAGVQAANPRCWLKNRVPAPIADSCCTSGVHN
jgi:hypothetical protein